MPSSILRSSNAAKNEFLVTLLCVFIRRLRTTRSDNINYQWGTATTMRNNHFHGGTKPLKLRRAVMHYVVLNSRFSLNQKLRNFRHTILFSSVFVGPNTREFLESSEFFLITGIFSNTRSLSLVIPQTHSRALPVFQFVYSKDDLAVSMVLVLQTAE